jgi:hypothetical protein
MSTDGSQVLSKKGANKQAMDNKEKRRLISGWNELALITQTHIIKLLTKFLRKHTKLTISLADDLDIR